MPMIAVTMSRKLTEAEKKELHSAALEYAAELLQKPRERVMVLVTDGAQLQRGETSGACAFCTVRLLGRPEQADADRFAEAMSGAIARIGQCGAGNVYLSIEEMRTCYTDGLPPHGRP